MTQVLLVTHHQDGISEFMLAGLMYNYLQLYVILNLKLKLSQV